MKTELINWTTVTGQWVDTSNMKGFSATSYYSEQYSNNLYTDLFELINKIKKNKLTLKDLIS